MKWKVTHIEENRFYEGFPKTILSVKEFNNEQEARSHMDSFIETDDDLWGWWKTNDPNKISYRIALFFQHMYIEPVEEKQ